MTPIEFHNCKKEFFDTTVADVLRAIDGNSLMGAVTLGLIAFEVLSMAIDPQKMTNREESINSLFESYMGEIRIDYSKKIKEFKIVRNAL